MPMSDFLKKYTNKYTFISLGIVLAISLWWYLGRPKTLRASAEAELAKSNGTLDVHAKKALRVLDQIEQPTAHDRFTAARVIELNGHEGRINNVRVLDDVVGRYMYNLVDDDGLDWFEIDQIENFTERNQDILYNPRYETFRETVQKQRPKMLQTTISEAKQVAKNRVEAFATYVDDSVIHTNDTQNVHDSAVNEQLRKSYAKLRETTPDAAIAKAKAEIPTAVSRHLGGLLGAPEELKRAETALSKILEGKHNTTLNANERDLLTLVWARSCMNENFSNKALIRDAVVQALRDMGEEGSEGGVVCSGGRCARLLESLVLTDQDDKAVSGLMTTEQIRNDVMERSNTLLNSTIEEFADAGADEDAGMVQVAKSYRDPSVTASVGDEKKFKAVVKAKIHKLIDQEYAEKLSDRDLTNIRAHCLAAIESI